MFDREENNYNTRQLEPSSPFHRSHYPAAGGHGKSPHRAGGPPRLALGSVPCGHQIQMNTPELKNTYNLIRQYKCMILTSAAGV